METAKEDPWNNNYLVEVNQKDDSNNGYVSVRTRGKDMRDDYVNTTLDSNLDAYELDAAGKVSAPDTAANGCLDTDLEKARTNNGTKTADKVDDYVLGTWYLDGQIFSATAGFTTNIESGILID